MSAHPIYLPSATIQAGNTSYRAESPSGSREITADEGEDLGLPDGLHSRKIEREIGLGQPTNAELAAEKDILLHYEARTAKEAKEMQAKIMTSLRGRLRDVARADRFKATNAYSNPSQNHHASAPRSNTFNPFNLAVTTNATASAPAAKESHRDATYHARHYALPAERPMEVVALGRSPEEIDMLLKRAIESDTQLATQAQHTVIGGPAFVLNVTALFKTIGQTKRGNIYYHQIL